MINMLFTNRIYAFFQISAHSNGTRDLRSCVVYWHGYELTFTGFWMRKLHLTVYIAELSKEYEMRSIQILKEDYYSIGVD